MRNLQQIVVWFLISRGYVLMRIDYLDKAKGFCIALVVLGHICKPKWGGTIPLILIYTVNVQAFFIISGILIEIKREYLKSWKETFWGNALRLLIPYYCFETLYNVVYSCFNGVNTLRWQEIDTLIFYGRGIATWFLPALFFAKNIVVFLKKTFHKQSVMLAFAGGLFGIGLFWNTLFSAQPLWIEVFICRILIGVGFLTVGVLLTPVIDKTVTSKKWGQIGLLFFFFILTALKNGQVSTYLMELNNPLFYMGSSVSGTISMLWICNVIPGRVLKYWGRNSIIVLGTHQTILLVLLTWLGKQYSITIAMMLWGLIMIIEFPVIEVINKWAPAIVGKKKP